MRKIQTIFKRNPENMKIVLDEPYDESVQWVFDGEGVPTVKVDGSACLIRGGKFYRRHNLKMGRKIPLGWVHWTFDPKQESGHGWIPVEESSPSDDYHVEAAVPDDMWPPNDGTYELVGPKIGKNPHKLKIHQLWVHGNPIENDAPGRTFETLTRYLELVPMEGIVWWHPDGRMAKIKSRDFGIRWPR